MQIVLIQNSNLKNFLFKKYYSVTLYLISKLIYKKQKI